MTKLLIITQKVDKNDPILGFFHRWIEEFSKHFESIIVICLEGGEYSLPENVRVLLLGKERGVSKFGYLINFYRYIWQERNSYDRVFVHMNQEYILLAGWLWEVWRKKVFMWRNHYAGNLLTDFAAFFCDKIFCTSKYSYTARYSKTAIMPVGIDTKTFNPDESTASPPRSILSLGRISASKNLTQLISALKELKRRKIEFSASIYGSALSSEKKYLDSLKEEVTNSGLEEKVRFYPGVKHSETPNIYRAHSIFVNASRSGMYDKTILEAAACGCRVLAVSADAQNDLPSITGFAYGEIPSLASTLEDLLGREEDFSRKKQQYDMVASKHGLQSLAEALVREINN